MVKICLNVSIFKHALIPKLCSIQWRIFTSEDSVKWYECCYYVSFLDSNFRQTASNNWHNKLYHYDGTFSQLFPIVLVYSLKWYFLSRNVIHLAIKFLFIHQIGRGNSFRTKGCPLKPRSAPRQNSCTYSGIWNIFSTSKLVEIWLYVLVIELIEFDHELIENHTEKSDNYFLC